MDNVLPTFKQMDNWLDADMLRMGMNPKDVHYRLGVLQGALMRCLDDPKKTRDLRAQILSFPEERP